MCYVETVATLPGIFELRNGLNQLKWPVDWPIPFATFKHCGVGLVFVPILTVDLTIGSLTGDIASRPCLAYR